MSLQSLTDRLAGLIPALDGWAITARYIPAPDWPDDDAIAMVEHDRRAREADIAILLTWQVRDHETTLAALIGHELAHVVLDGQRIEARCDAIGELLARAVIK